MIPALVRFSGCWRRNGCGQDWCDFPGFGTEIDAKRTGAIFRLQVQIRIFGTPAKTVHISAWSTPRWAIPASFERSLSSVSNAAALVQIGVDHAEI